MDDITAFMQAAGDPDGVKEEAMKEADVEDAPSSEPSSSTETAKPGDEFAGEKKQSREPTDGDRELFGDLLGDPVQADDLEGNDESEEGDEGDDEDAPQGDKLAGEESQGDDQDGEASGETKQFLEQISTQANANYESVDDVVNEIRRARGSQQYAQLLESDENLATLISTYLEADGDLEAAVQSTLPHFTTTEPDRYEDPEAWAQWKLEQERKEQQEAEQGQKQERLQKIQSQIHDQAQDAWQAFVDRRGLDQAEARKLAQEISHLTQGNLETGQIAPAMYERLAFAANYDQARKRMRSEIEKEVRREVADELKANGTLKTTDGLPWNSGSGSGPGREPKADKATRILQGSSTGFDHSSF